MRLGRWLPSAARRRMAWTSVDLLELIVNTTIEVREGGTWHRSLVGEVLEHPPERGARGDERTLVDPRDHAPDDVFDERHELLLERAALAREVDAPRAAVGGVGAALQQAA